MFKKLHWTPKQFSWLYATGTAFLIVFSAFSMTRLDIIELLNFRMIYIVIVLAGINLFMYDLSKHTDTKIGYTMAFTHCFRTGFYMCLLLIPFIVTLIYLGPYKLGMVDQGSVLTKQPAETGFCIAMMVEIFATMLIGSFVASFVPGMLRKNRADHR